MPRSCAAMEYRIKRAKLPERWSLGTYPWDKQPSVERRVIEQLAELHFVDAAENIVFIGDTGTGKTGLASALLLEALTAGYRGLFIKAQDLFDEMYASLADRSSRKLVNRLARIDLLVIDEMGYLNLRPEQTNIFFKLMEERYGRRATIITTNLEYEAWHDFLGNKAMVLRAARSPPPPLPHDPHRRALAARPDRLTAHVTRAPTSRSAPGSFLASTGGSLLASAEVTSEQDVVVVAARLDEALDDALPRRRDPEVLIGDGLGEGRAREPEVGQPLGRAHRSSP